MAGYTAPRLRILAEEGPSARREWRARRRERPICGPIAVPEGLEPPTPWFEAKCSIQTELRDRRPSAAEHDGWIMVPVLR